MYAAIGLDTLCKVMCNLLYIICKVNMYYALRFS